MSTAAAIFESLGLPLPNAAEGAPALTSRNPASGEVLAQVPAATPADYESTLIESQRAFQNWRLTPAPSRGEAVRLIGEEFRRHKDALGALISLEMGKIRSEGLGEVQEVIDICDFAVGLSRQLYGLSMHSERPSHRMYEQWHPLGPVGVITAFNFPMAVWAWNAMIAAVCGDTVIWKPSPKTPLCALAAQALAQRAMQAQGHPGVFSLLNGGNELGERMSDDARIPLLSFTGSVRAGREVAQRVAKRLGRSLLELGGNNGILVMDDADLDLALHAVAFGAAGTTGQRCTSTRRLYLQKGIAQAFIEKLLRAYRGIAIGNPLDEGVLMGPLIDAAAVSGFERAVAAAQAEGGKLLAGGMRLARPGYFVEPTLIHGNWPMKTACEETFAPILYIFEFGTLERAIEWHNEVPQGLSSAIFTSDLRAAERFLSAAGSDCGIANVNIGTSGAEIGGAFGGEKDTGGGRESGSDSWKAYMRRQTCTINYGDALPLAQGVRFEL